MISSQRKSFVCQPIANFNLIKLINLQFYSKGMNGLSVAMKLKSIEKAQPILPKALKMREPSATGRTSYENVKSSEIIKQFRKQHLYTCGNLSTQKSQSHLNDEDNIFMKQSRFDDDHHNTQSIQQLLDTKMEGNLPSSRPKHEDLNKKSIQHSQEKLVSPEQSLESQSLGIDEHSLKSSQKESKQEHVEQMQIKENQGQNYDDYVLGDKISEKQQGKEMKDNLFKRYRFDHNIIEPGNNSAQSLVRADFIHYKNQSRRLIQLKDDQEIVSIMQKYKNHKQTLLNQSKRKHQTHRIMAAINTTSQMQKSYSLPLLKAKREIEIPEIQQKVSDKTKFYLLKTDAKRIEKNNSSELVSSLSSGKLGLGRKKIKTISEREIYQDEMNTLDNIKMKLRSKGIAFDSNNLTKGTVTIKNELQKQKINIFPEKNLPSNPIYKKFPL